MSTRRMFLTTGALAVASVVPYHPVRAGSSSSGDLRPPIQDPGIQELVQRALDAARTAGAHYADVRLTRTHLRMITGGSLEYAWVNVGVRALVNSVWGFASGSLWRADTMTRLATEAVRQANAGSPGTARRIELAPLDAPATGHWETPVAIDPFTVPISEIQDITRSLNAYAKQRVTAQGYLFSHGSFWYICSAQDKAFGSTDGSYCTQRLLRSGGEPIWRLGMGMPIAMDRLPISGAGWERVVEQPLRDYTDRAIDDAIVNSRLPEKPVEIGRYDLVFDAASVASLVGATIGQATEADRVMGYEANATGTSYITAPHEMLGSFRLGSPLLTVTGNRTEVGGAATVRWDDDGVTPDEFTLVKQGVLTDLSTTRESAMWFKEAYAKTGQPVRSHGCALGAHDSIGRGMHLPVGWVPNLQMAPGPEALDFDACVAGVSNGIAFQQMTFTLDFQQSNGIGWTTSGTAFAIRNGKRVARLQGAGVLFRAQDLWRSLSAVGGAQSRRQYGLTMSKGEPPQSQYYSVSAVPAVFTNAAVIDMWRRA